EELEKVEGLGKYNWFTTSNTGKDLIMAQYGTAFKVDKIDARLLRITEKGVQKQIDLGALLNFRGISVAEYFDDSFMMIAVSSKGGTTPVTPVTLYWKIVHFNYDLEMIGEVYTLPENSGKSEFNYWWG